MANNKNFILSSLDVTAGYGKKTVIKNFFMEITKGSFVSIIGPNGSGKSTILRVFSRLLHPMGGVVLLNAQDMRSIPTKHIARTLAILPQIHVMPDEVTVYDIVSYGRFPHEGTENNSRKHNAKVISRALAMVSIEEYSSRPLSSLSGGERQRVWLAMALAQEPEIILLDEPTTYLDIRFQLEILELIKKLNVTTGLTVLATLHDINHASRFSDRIIALKNGAIAADGSPSDIMNERIIADIFGVSGIVVPGALGSYFIAMNPIDQ